MNLHITLTTIPHPEDLQAGRCDIVQSAHVTTPEHLASVVKTFLDRANQTNLWGDRGSMMFMIQPMQLPKNG